MSRELQATLISAAMIALVFLVASHTGKRTTTTSAPVVIYGVELARDASQDAVLAVAEQLDAGVKAAVLGDLSVSEVELLALRDEILAHVMAGAREAWTREIQTQREIWPHVNAAVIQMPDRAVSAYDEQTEFIATLRLPDDVDRGQIRYLLSLAPEPRKERMALFTSHVNRLVEDLLAELRDLYAPRAERQALRQLICDRSTAFRPETATRPEGDLLGVSASCAAYVIRHVGELLPEALDEEALLRARVLSVLSLAQAH